MMKTHKWVTALLLLYLSIATADASAQANAAPAEYSAHEIHDDLQVLFNQHPPSVRRVLRLDPSLLRNEAYLATYPALAAFVAQHPEVANDATFYVGRPETDPDTFGAEGVAITIVMLTTVGVGIWLVKTVIGHLRWLRVMKVQTEAHTKLLDRFSANAELLAYIQSPAGRRFLERTPAAIDPTARPIGAPISRILWSVQAGIVAIFGGIGMHLVNNQLAERSSEEFFVLGTLGIALGAAFVLSAFVSYILSRRLGLMNESPLERTGNEHA